MVIEVEVWKHITPDYTEFFLKWEGLILRISKREGCKCEKCGGGKWMIVPARIAFGNKSDPLSFLLITGHSIEEVWKLGSRISVSDYMIVLG